MNEQFKRVWNLAQSSHVRGESSRETQENLLERYAEIIISECLKIIEPTEYHRAFPSNFVGGIDGMDLLDHKAQEIKKHFNIKK